MRIAKVVKSNSHVDYVGRILDRLETSDPPSPAHYRFGQFVSIPAETGLAIESAGSENWPAAAKSTHQRSGTKPDHNSNHDYAVGIIYNSQLINPDYDRLGPRLSSPVEMNAVFSPDLLNEQGVLIGVLLVGWLDTDGTPRQGIPRTVIPVNSEIDTMPDDAVGSFHRDPSGRIAIHYYSHVMTHARQFAQQLLLAVLDQLQLMGPSESLSEIQLLRQTLNWQQVFQNKSL
ncbi:MAG TPA: hypothetical protein VEZ90_08905 [Blastocatellia bacterium]|nr:hypothetical protein [Blastocatellia bacterium]